MKICFLMFTLCVSLATWTDDSAQSEPATLILYRRKDYFRQDFIVKINDKLITKLFSNNEFIQIEVPAGRLKIETEGGYTTEKKRMLFTLNPHETVYLKGIVDYDYFSNALYFKRVDSNQALKDIKNTELDESAQKKTE